MRHRLPVPAFLLVLSGCAASENPSSAGEAALAAAREQVSQRVSQYATLLLNPDVNVLLDFWTPDAIVQEPGIQISTAEQSKLARDFFTTNRIAEFNMVTSELSAHDAGAVVYQAGYYSEVVQSKDSAAPAATYRQNFLARWQRGPDGTWRFQRFLATPRPDVGEVLPVAAAADEPAGSIAVSVATTQITSRMNDYSAALRANQPTAVIAFWKDDAQFFEPDVQLSGKTALTQLVQGALNSIRIIDHQYQTDQLYVHDRGTVAYQFGNFTETFQTRDGSRPAVTVRNNFVARWRRGADGSWRMDRFFGTPAPAMAASANAPTTQ